MKTIKQIAEEIGVSKQAIEKRISRAPDIQAHITKNDKGIKLIDIDGEKLIRAMYVPTDKDIDKGIDTPIDKVDALLNLVSEQQKTIQELTTANRELTVALENTTASLQAAQALHAGTMQTHLLTDKEEEKPRSWFKRLFNKK